MGSDREFKIWLAAKHRYVAARMLAEDARGALGRVRGALFPHRRRRLLRMRARAIERMRVNETGG